MKHIKLFENQASFDTYRGGGGNIDYPLVADVDNKTYILTPPPAPIICYTTTNGNQISNSGTYLSSYYIVSHTKESNGEYKIILKDTMTDIPVQFFSNQTTLQTMRFENFDKVTSIGSNFLYRCTSLVTLTMPDTTGITAIGPGYLSMCDKLTTIYCPKGTLDFYKQLMKNRASKMVELS